MVRLGGHYASRFMVNSKGINQTALITVVSASQVNNLYCSYYTIMIYYRYLLDNN